MPKVYTVGAQTGNVNSFSIIQTPNGTSPVADSPTDTLNLTSSDSSITITGDSTTDSVDFVVNMAGVGDVDGPASATDESIALFDGITGKLLKSSVVTIDPTGDIANAASIDFVSLGVHLVIDHDHVEADGNLGLVSGSGNVDITANAGGILLTCLNDIDLINNSATADINLTPGRNVVITTTTGNTLLLNDQIFPETKPAPITQPYLTIDPGTGQMFWDSLATAVPTLDAVYEAGPIITLSAMVGKIEIRDTGAGIGGNLFEIENNAGSTQYFAVTASGFSGTRMDVDNIRADGNTLSATSGDLNLGIPIDQKVAIGNVSGTPILNILDRTTAGGTFNVGLNVASPTELFEATNTAGSRASFVFRAMNSSTTASFVLEDQAANTWSTTFINNTNLFWRYNSTAMMRMGTDGRLRIENGTGNPTLARLHVVETTPEQEVFRFESVTTGVDPNLVCKQNRVQTTNATPTTCLTLALTDTRTTHIYARITARQTVGTTVGDAAGYIIEGTYKQIAGTVTLVGALTVVHAAEDSAAWDATLVISGTSVIVQVTGEASKTIIWHASAITSET